MPFFCETLPWCWEEEHFLTCLFVSLGLVLTSSTIATSPGHLLSCPVPPAPASEEDWCFCICTLLVQALRLRLAGLGAKLKAWLQALGWILTSLSISPGTGLVQEKVAGLVSVLAVPCISSWLC